MKTLIGMVAMALLSLQAHAQAQIYVYPAAGQSEELQQRDRYECHQWAVKNTGFDPLHSKPVAEPKWVRVPSNPHAGATEKGLLGGVLAGAAIGEIDANNPGRGAAIGAVVGSIIGSVVEQKGAQESRERARQERQERKQDKREQAVARGNYRRALEACLEGRGYSVN